MLTILGFAMIATFLVLIMLKKMSPIAALVLIPALFCVLVGEAAHLGDYVIDGVAGLAPTAAMLMFAIVYFGVMIDVGLFDPVVRGILRFCKADTMRIVVGTAVLGLLMLGRGWVRPHGREWGLLAVCGVGWFGIYNVALNAAEQHLDAGTTAMLVNREACDAAPPRPRSATIPRRKATALTTKKRAGAPAARR